MNELQNATVLHLEPPMMVHSEKGRVFHMENRRSYGLSLCLSGQITYRMAGRTVVSHPGNAVLLPRNGCYTLTGDREGLFPLLNFQTVEPVSREILVFPLQDPQACLRDFETLQQLFLFEGSRHESFSVFYSLLHKVTAAQQAGTNPLTPVLLHIEANLADRSLSNQSLAHRLGISEVYLRRLFTAHCGCTPKQYILQLRLRKARQMLVNTPASVTEIADACGFSGPYHFCRIFKEKTGMTPTAYARQHRIYQI